MQLTSGGHAREVQPKCSPQLSPELSLRLTSSVGISKVSSFTAGTSPAYTMPTPSRCALPHHYAVCCVCALTVLSLCTLCTLLSLCSHCALSQHYALCSVCVCVCSHCALSLHCAGVLCLTTLHTAPGRTRGASLTQPTTPRSTTISALSSCIFDCGVFHSRPSFTT